MDILIWLGLFLIFLVAEVLTVGLISIWFAVGALISLLLSIVNVPMLVTIPIFVLTSIVTMLAIRPIAKKHFNKKTSKTNVEAMAGKTARVVERIDNAMGSGRAVLNGLEWMARSESGEVIETEAYVTVIRVEGVKLIVTKS